MTRRTLLKSIFAALAAWEFGASLLRAEKVEIPAPPVPDSEGVLTLDMLNHALDELGRNGSPNWTYAPHGITLEDLPKHRVEIDFS